MSLKLIVFSPTGGTKAVADLLASNFDVDPSHIDLCDAGADFSSCEITSNDEAIIAMPSFGGRAPQVAIERLAEISGNGTACTLACVYGNRAYEDTLIEMADAAKAAGFKWSPRFLRWRSIRLWNNLRAAGPMPPMPHASGNSA